MLSKKDHNAIANAIKWVREDWKQSRDAIIASDMLIERLAKVFAGQNPRFDVERFRTAARGEVPAWGTGPQAAEEARAMLGLLELACVESGMCHHEE